MVIHAENKVVKANELRRGMVVLPYKGSTYQIAQDALDWKMTLYAEWWQHIVIGVDTAKVTLARPYAYACDHNNTTSPLLGCEVYSVPIDSTSLFMIQRHEMTT